MSDLEAYESAPQSMRTGKVTESGLLAAAMVTKGPLRRQLLALLPPYTFRHRINGIMYHRIARTLSTGPDNFTFAELASLAGVAPDAIVSIDAEYPQISLQEAIKNVLAQRVAECLTSGIDPAPYAMAIAEVGKVQIGGEDQAQQKRLLVPATDLLQKTIEIKKLVGRLIEQGVTGQIFGPSGSGKTFISLDLAAKIATGGGWNGHACSQGVVIYLSGEGHGGLKRRVRAWEKCNGKNLSSLLVSSSTVSFSGGDLERVVIEAREAGEQCQLPVLFIVVDTLARHIEGDENVSRDMSQFIRVVDELRGNFPGASALIVHHTGNSDDAKMRGRGSSALKAAMDFEIHCDKGLLTFTKLKDAEIPEPTKFKLVPVELGADQDGEPIKSCIVEYGERSHRDQEAQLTGFERMGLQALISACVTRRTKSEAGMYLADPEAWRDEFYSIRRVEEPGAKQNTLRSQFNRITGVGPQGGGLKEKGIVAFTIDGVIPLRQSDQFEINTRILSTVAPLQGVAGALHETGEEPLHVARLYNKRNDATLPIPPTQPDFSQLDEILKEAAV